MKINDMPIGATAYTQLASTALAVLSRREDGWCVYVRGVRGENHDHEWQDVLAQGDKLDEATAEAIVRNRFYPGFDPDGCPYAL